MNLEKSISILFSQRSRPDDIQVANTYLMQLFDTKECYSLTLGVLKIELVSLDIRHFIANMLYNKVKNKR